MQTNSAAEQNKKTGVRPVGREKDLPKSQVLSSQWKTEQVKEDGSGDSEDGEDDELPCVIEKWRRLCLARLAKISGEFFS